MLYHLQKQTKDDVYTFLFFMRLRSSLFLSEEALQSHWIYFELNLNMLSSNQVQFCPPQVWNVTKLRCWCKYVFYLALKSAHGRQKKSMVFHNGARWRTRTPAWHQRIWNKRMAPTLDVFSPPFLFFGARTSPPPPATYYSSKQATYTESF